MNAMTFQALVMALSSVMLSALAQMVFKWAMTQSQVKEAVSLLSEGAALRTILVVLLSPGVLAGFALYGASAVIWLFVLSKLDLSVAYPFVGLGFIATMLAGVIIFHEPVGTLRVVGTLLVVAGVCLVARS